MQKDARLKSAIIRDLRYGAELVAIVAAGAWAFYTFIYSERIKPLSEPGAINVSITENIERPPGASEFVTFYIHFDNPGSRPMDVAGEYYNIYGARLVPAPLSGAIRPQRWALWHDEHFQDARLIGSTGYIRAGGGGSGHILLRPGERDVENITIAVPRNRYAALHLYWTVYLGIAPINPPFKLRTQRRSDGAIVINGLYPHDDGEQMVVL